MRTTGPQSIVRYKFNDAAQLPLTNGRCKNHGGMSTGPKTQEGRRVVAEATRKRMASGQQQRALEGYFRWLAGGDREMLSKLAKARHRRRYWQRLMESNRTHRARTRVMG